MTVTKKVKSCPKPVAHFVSNLENVKSNKRLYLKKYQSDNRRNNQQKYINCLKQDQIKMNVSIKNVVTITFMCLIIKIFHL